MSLLNKKYLVYVITFLAYSAVHASRSIWSYSKTYFQNSVNCQQELLGIMDSSFLITYAISLKLLSQIGDNKNLKLFITLGMIGASFFITSIGMSSLIFQNKDIWIYPILMSLNGLCQSTQWPGLLKTMGNWFGKGKRGLLIGIWSGNASIGNIIGYQIGFITIHKLKYQWEYAFFASAIFYIFMAITIILIIKTAPKKETIDLSINAEENLIVSIKKRKLSLKEVWQLKGVKSYALCYFCVKSCAYGFLFWLPTYLNSKGFQEQSSFMASMYDIGAFIGGILTGYTTDKLGKRCILMWPMLLTAAFCCFCVKQFLSENAEEYYIMIFLIGIFLGGPYGIVSAVISLDFAQQKELQDVEFLSTLSGLIEGIGSLGSGFIILLQAILQIIIGFLDINLIFYLLMAQCIFAALAITNFFIKDVQSFRKGFQNKDYNQV